MSDSETITVNKSYEEHDHRFRHYDQYALAKYNLTLGWLKKWDSLQGKTLLNVGCGAGLFNRLAAEAGARVLGIEPDPASLQLAQQEGAGHSIELIHGDAYSISADRKFDIIVMHDVLEHIKDDGAVIEHLSKLLADSGRLILSVPALPVLFGLHDENLGHYRRYTRSTLRCVVQTHFITLRSRYFGASFIPVVWLLSVLLRTPYPLTEASTGWKAKVLRLICQTERLLPLPLGTSLIVEAKKRT